MKKFDLYEALKGTLALTRDGRVVTDFDFEPGIPLCLGGYIPVDGEVVRKRWTEKGATGMNESDDDLVSCFHSQFLAKNLTTPGMKIITRDGRKVRFLNFDSPNVYPVRCLVEGEKHPQYFTMTGRFNLFGHSVKDLFMISEPFEMKWRIINVWYGPIKPGKLFDSEIEAREHLFESNLKGEFTILPIYKRA